MYLDTKSNFQEYLKNILKQGKQSYWIIAWDSSFFTAPIFNYDIRSIFKTPSQPRGYCLRPKTKDSFHQKMKSTQYNAAVAITGGIRGTSREKLYQGLGLESSV